MKRASPRKDSVHQFIINNPGCTTNDIGSALGIDPKNASAVCTTLFSEGKITRKEIRRLASNRPVFAYYPVTAGDMVSSGTRLTRNVFSREQKMPGIDGMLNDLAEIIVLQLVDKIKGKLTAEIQTIIPGTVQTTAALQEPVIHQGNATLRRVGVVGLFPHERTEIESEFKDSFRLSFWQNGDGWNSLTAIAQFCDVVFVVIRHVSHRTTDHLKSNKANISNIEGGASSLKVAMTDFYLKQAA